MTSRLCGAARTSATHLDPLAWICDHQVAIQKRVGVFSEALHNRSPQCQVWNKVTVLSTSHAGQRRYATGDTVCEEPHKAKVGVWPQLTMTSTCSQSAPRLITFWPSSASLAKSADNIEGEIMVAGRSRPASLVGKGIPMALRATPKQKTRD